MVGERVEKKRMNLVSPKKDSDYQADVRANILLLGSSRMERIHVKKWQINHGNHCLSEGGRIPHRPFEPPAHMIDESSIWLPKFEGFCLICSCIYHLQ
jgi:hypothetical protein